MPRKLVAVACVGLLLSACATEDVSTGANGQPISEVQKAQARCRAVILTTAILGAGIGAAASRRNRGSGAAIGAGAGALAGAGFCGVMLSVANEKDRQHIAEAQQRALETGIQQRESYTGDDGKVRTIQVSTEAVEASNSGFADAGSLTQCRKRYTDIEVQGIGNPAQVNEVICRKPDGSYVTKTI
jgi:surface antigen